jgi:magnesium-transporting ATPase (P-type)
MITGDNTLTGSNISYKCSISDKTKNMIICDFDKKFIEESFIFHDYDNAVGFEPDKPIAESYIEEDIRVSLMSKEIRSSSRQRSSLRDISESEF